MTQQTTIMEDNYTSNNNTRAPTPISTPKPSSPARSHFKSFDVNSSNFTNENENDQAAEGTSLLSNGIRYINNNNSSSTDDSQLTVRDYNRPPEVAAQVTTASASFVLADDDCQSQGHLHFANCSTATAAAMFSTNNTNNATQTVSHHQQQQQQPFFQTMNINHEELNFSQFEQVWLVKSWPEILLRVVFVVPIVLLGIVGNLTIIYSITKFKRFRTKPTNIFILNMAIADLLTTIVCPTAALFTDIYQFYVLGAFLCRFEGFIKITCLLVSAYSLIVLSYDWLLSVVRPCRTRINIRQSWLTLASIWLVSILMASPLFVWRRLRERKWRDLMEVWCCELIQYTKYYWICITFLLIYLPTLIMTIVLVVILAQMDQFEAKLKRSRANGGQQQQQQVANHHHPASNASSLSITMKYRRRIVKILFTYLLTSMICWTPLQFTIIYRHFRSEAIPAEWFFELVFFAQLCASLSSAMNPIIFGFLSQPFRHIVTKSWLFRLLDKMMTTQNNQTNNNNNNNNDNNNNYQMNHRNHNNNNNNNNDPPDQHNGQKLKPATRRTSFTGGHRPTAVHNQSDHRSPNDLHLITYDGRALRATHLANDHRHRHHHHQHHQQNGRHPPRATSLNHHNHHKHVKSPIKAQHHTEGNQQKSISSSDLTRLEANGARTSTNKPTELTNHKRRKEARSEQLSGHENVAYDTMGDQNHHHPQASTSSNHHNSTKKFDAARPNGKTKLGPDKRSSDVTNGIHVTTFISVKPAAELNS